MHQPTLLSIKDASKRMGLSSSRLYRLLEVGLIPYIVAGSLRFVPADALDGLEFTPDEIVALVTEKKRQLSARQKEMGTNEHRSVR